MPNPYSSFDYSPQFIFEVSGFAANSVDSSKIINGTITGSDIALETITDANIAVGTITEAKLSSALQTKLADFDTRLTALETASPPANTGFWGSFVVFNVREVDSSPRHLHAYLAYNDVPLTPSQQINGDSDFTFNVAEQDRLPLPSSILQLKITFQNNTDSVNVDAYDGFEVDGYTENPINEENTLNLLVNANNYDNGSCSITYIVSYIPVPNPTASITTTAANISPNGVTTITPVFTNATIVTINGSTTTPSGGAIISNTAFSVYPSQSIRYTLVVTNSVGVQQSAFVDINVVQNPTASITTTNANITSGQSTTITPVFTNGEIVTIDGSTTTPSGGAIISNTAFSVSPTTNKTYNLVVTNSVGVQQSASVTINVTSSSWWSGNITFNRTYGAGNQYIFLRTEAGTIANNQQYTGTNSYNVTLPNSQNYVEVAINNTGYWEVGSVNFVNIPPPFAYYENGLNWNRYTIPSGLGNLTYEFTSFYND